MSQRDQLLQALLELQNASFSGKSPRFTTDCPVRAGECASARRIFNETYPTDALARLAPADRERVLTSNFDFAYQK